MEHILQEVVYALRKVADESDEGRAAVPRIADEIAARLRGFEGEVFRRAVSDNFVREERGAGSLIVWMEIVGREAYESLVSD